MRSRSLFFPALIIALLLADPAFAHPDAGAAFSFSAGFGHPLGGLDHLLAMFVVGLLAAQLGGAATWWVPAAFVTTMVGGALLGFVGISAPGVELAIAASIVAIALPVVLVLDLPPIFAMAFVGWFAVFHGQAHAAELPAGAESVPYLAGFALATAAVLMTGVGAGLLCERTGALRTLRVTGGAVALAGLGLLAA